MKKIIPFFFFFIAILALQAETYGIFVDGSYSPSKKKDSTMDKVIDSRLAEADKQMGRLFPASKREKVDSKAKLLAALKAIKCKCGDEINVTMMGHGERGRFVFSKSNGKEKFITAKELREALGASAVECCCKINIVIFSCHSGSMLNELLEEEHVKSVYTSCLGFQKSHTSIFFENKTTFVDLGDWMKGFNHDLALVRNAKNMADAFEQAALTARERTPIDFVRKETPMGWKRGDHKILAHVSGSPVKIRIGRRLWTRIKVTYYEPHWMRGREEWIYFTDKPPGKYRKCNWITSTVTFGHPKDRIIFTGEITHTKAPTEQILAHVLSGYGDKKNIKVHTVSPKWQFCKKQFLYYEDKKKINPKLVRCNWIRQTVSVTDPGQRFHTKDPINPATPTFRIRFHVEKYDPKTHILSGKPLNTDGKKADNWLNGYTTIIIPPNERGKMTGIKKCDNIFVDITMSDQGNKPPTGSNIRKVHRDVVNGYSYDIAANTARPHAPTLVGTIVPKVTLTNVGEQDMGFDVEVAIGKLGNGDWIAEWIQSNPPSGGNIWTKYQTIDNLGAAQSIEVSFGNFRFIPNTDYTMVFAVRSEKDEVERNDTTSIHFRFDGQVSAKVPDGVGISASGTGRTTGGVVIVNIQNPHDSAVVLELGPFLIPSDGQSQPYVIPQVTEAIVPAGEQISIPLTGYCVDVRKPPVSAGSSVVDFKEWITPATMQPVSLDGAVPPLDAFSYHPISKQKTVKSPATVITYPGSDKPFQWTIDIARHPKEAAPYIFNAVESISLAYDELYDTDNIQTPFNSDLIKEKKAVVQHTLWKYTTALEGGNYTVEDFKKNAVKEAESILKQPLNVAPTAVQEQVAGGIASFWDSFEAVGVHAKVLKKG